MNNTKIKISSKKNSFFLYILIKKLIWNIAFISKIYYWNKLRELLSIKVLKYSLIFPF